jgi:hypothetical protein
MFAKILFTLFFLSQIAVISVFLPAKLIRSVRSALLDGRHFSALSLWAYRAANSLVVLLGAGLLVVLFQYSLFDKTTITLASIGLYFFLQLLPLALLNAMGSVTRPARLESSLDEKTASQLRSLRLFQATSPIAAGLALLLVVAYLLVKLAAWSGQWDTHLLQIVIFVGVNLFSAGVIMSAFSTLRKTDRDSIAAQHRAVRMTTNLLIFVSIMISTYYFFKEAIFIFELNQFRPAMMSAFLHLPALLLFIVLFFGEPRRED